MIEDKSGLAGPVRCIEWAAYCSLLVRNHVNLPTPSNHTTNNLMVKRKEMQLVNNIRARQNRPPSSCPLACVGGGSELQFLTPFPDESLENDGRLACRNTVFSLRGTVTFQNLVSKVFATLQWFAHEVPRALFVTIENTG